MIYNEASNPTYFFLGAQLMGVLLASLVWHELGHMIYFKLWVKKNIQIFFQRKGWTLRWFAGKQHDYNVLTDNQYVGVNLAGVILGTLPIMVVSFFMVFPIIWMLVPYGVGCWNDLKEIYKMTDHP